MRLTLHFALSLLHNAQADEPERRLKCAGESRERVRAYLNLLLENLMVLLLLVQHMLLLGLLQGSLINLPPVHLLQLLTLLRGKAVGIDRAQPGPAHAVISAEADVPQGLLCRVSHRRATPLLGVWTGVLTLCAMGLSGKHQGQRGIKYEYEALAT